MNIDFYNVYMEMNVKQIANVHKVLCDKVRLTILEFIKNHDGVTTSDILSKIKIDPSTLSFHISKMEKCNLILKKNKGKFIIYRINKPILSLVHRFMYDSLDIALTKYFSMNQEYYFHLDDFVEIYKLYSDPIRLKIWRTICENPGICGKELAILTKESEANLSFHLKKLIKNKVIDFKKISNQHHYWLDIGYALAFHKAVSKTRNEK